MRGESRAEVRSNARDQFERLALISMQQFAGTHFEIANDFSINAVAVIPHDGTLNAAHFAHQVFNFTRFDADATHFELEVHSAVKRHDSNFVHRHTITCAVTHARAVVRVDELRGGGCCISSVPLPNLDTRDDQFAMSAERKCAQL